MRKIILASQSPQRRIMLETLQIPFDILPANIDEKSIGNEDHKLRAALIAKAKAKKVAQRNSEAIVIAADTFTLFKNKAYEKPRNNNEAIAMLKEQSGQTGLCYSGFAYLDKQNNIQVNTVAITEISFRKLSNIEIQKYVNDNPVLTWSAAFCPAYPAGTSLIANVNGSFSSFTHGLPMEILVPLLRQSGVFNEKI